MKLFVYKTVKCEVINVAFLSRDLPLNNSEIMAKWKCLKVLYSSKGMYRIYCQLKTMIRLKYLFLETPYTFFSIFSWCFSFTHTTLYHLFFLVLAITNFHFLAFPIFPFLCFFLHLWKRKYLLLNIFSIDLINLRNTTNLNSSLEGGELYNISRKWGGELHTGELAFYGRLDNPL